MLLLGVLLCFTYYIFYLKKAVIYDLVNIEFSGISHDEMKTIIINGITPVNKKIAIDIFKKTESHDIPGCFQTIEFITPDTLVSKITSVRAILKKKTYTFNISDLHSTLSSKNARSYVLPSEVKSEGTFFDKLSSAYPINIVLSVFKVIIWSLQNILIIFLIIFCIYCMALFIKFVVRIMLKKNELLKKKINSIKSILYSFSQSGKVQRIIFKIISSDLFWLLIICGICRLLYYYCLSNIYCYFEDSKSYLYYTANIFIGRVDGWRTPVYPYFIKLIKFFSSENYIQNVVIVQSIISFFSIILFYKTLCLVFKKRAIIFLASLIFGIMPTIVNFDKCIYTESISISAGILFLYFIVSYLKKPTMLKALLFSSYVFFLIMLRPAFISLLPLIIIFWITRIVFNKSEWKICLYGLAASSVSILLVLGYSKLNYIQNGFNGISMVFNANQMDNIINYNIYQNGNDYEISNTIQQNMIFHPVSNPNNDTIQAIVKSKYDQQRINKFIHNCIKNNLNKYTYCTLKKIYYLSFKTTSIIFADTIKEGYTVKWFWLISSIISFPFIVVFALLFIDFIYILRFWNILKQPPWLKIIIFSIIAMQLITCITGAQGEYMRLFVISLPYVIVQLFSYIDMMFYSINKKKLANYIERFSKPII
jgi:hypothetical protein